MSIVDWIEESVPGGIASPSASSSTSPYTIESGADSDDQSSLNLLYLLGFVGQGQFRAFGKSNEKYHVQGGNDQIVTTHGRRARGPDHDGGGAHRDPAHAGGRYTSRRSFRGRVDDGHRGRARPRGSVLDPRRSVDLSRGLLPLEAAARSVSRHGHQLEAHVQFATRHWDGLGSNGETYPTAATSARGTSPSEPGANGILVDYTGGRIGASFGSGPEERAARFLAQIEPVLPGITSQWNGRASIDFWPGLRVTRGSYSYYRVGQYTAFADIEPRQEGSVHFCGEHTTIDFQGT